MGLIIFLLLVAFVIFCIVRLVKMAKAKKAAKNAPAPERPKPTENTYEFYVAGIGHRLDDVMSFAEEDDDYKLSASKLAEASFGGKVYRYYFPTLPCTVEPEPGNKFDPNAMAVYADGVQVGYIAASETDKARKILSGALGEIVDCRISFEGGDFKEPDLDDSDKWIVEKGKDPIFGTIRFKVRPSDPADLTEVILTPKDIK